MKESENTSMSDKLFDLCELQLLSIIKDAEVSIAKITSSTTDAVKNSAELRELIKSGNGDREKDVVVSAELEERVNEVLVNMQFFDEFSQRIQHIMEIVELIKQESNKEGFLSDPKNSDELFKNIYPIFSMRSEFEVLRKIFPDSGKVDKSELIELF
ncbi:MAG: hypothetical protein RKH07_09390 [Gammaproteobacteria bacterium]